MDQNRQRTPVAAKPLLMNYVRERSQAGAAFVYDAAQHLNVLPESGEPVVASKGGPALAKTHAVEGED